MRKWTEKELNIAIEMVKSGESYQAVADELNRNKDSVRKKMVKLGVRSMAKPTSPNEWTVEQEEKLILLANKGLTNNELGVEFNRNPPAIGRKLQRLGYKRKEKYTEKDYQTFIKLVNEGYSNKDISKLTGFTLQEVQSRLHKLGCKRPKQDYRYSVGQIVGQGTLRIVEKTKGRRNQKSYKVQSLKYISTQPYLMNEDSVDKNTKDLYLSNRKICPENSLWSNKNIRKFIIDVEEAKRLAPYHNKPIRVLCPECKTEKKITPNALSTKEDIACKNCPSYLSFPEKVFYQYLLLRDLYYDRHVTLNDFNREFDFIDKFGNIYEVNGEQHYKQSKSTAWENAYKKSKTSDKEKIEYCNRKNINLTFIDCRKSNFNYIINSIQNTLEDRLEEKEIEVIKYNVAQMDKNISAMLDKYKEGCTVKELSTRYSIKEGSVYSLLKKYGIKRKPVCRKIKCINTGELFNTIAKASDTYNIDSSSISKACRGRQIYAGKHPVTGEKLTWEYVD